MEKHVYVTYKIAYNLYGELGISQIRAVMVDYAQTDAKLQKRGYFHAQSFRVNFYKRMSSCSLEYVFEGKERAKFLDELVYYE